MNNKKNNTGIENSGDCNSGDCNSGNYNSGNYNSGDCNSGYCNSGNYNSGDCNSGDCNSGYRNSGDCNSGNYNSGDYNSGDYNSGFFNTDEPTIRLFNKDTGKKRVDITIPYIQLPVTIWVGDSEMTNDEKVANPQFHIAGGYLKKLEYKDAWREAWSKLTAEVKQQFLNLPNFDADIFLEITGVDVREKATCNGKVVEIDGKKYKLTEVK